jgi:1-acyl-sn-glycerol-3-phosphate acyltransferase
MPLKNWPKPIRQLLFWLLGIHWAHRFLTNLSADKPSKLELLDRIFQRNHFDIKVTGENKIPQGRSCIIATNHPHGLFDGLSGIWLGSKNGNDCRAIGRHFLSVFEPIREWFLLVKVDSDRQAQAARQILDQSVNFLKDGGSLVVTPAARVSVSRPLWKTAEDLPWKSGVVQLSRRAKAPIVLVYIDVNQSVIRQLGQSIHGVVRALMQVWAYRFGRTQKLHLHVLEVIHPEQIPPGTLKAQTQWLQARFDSLVCDARNNLG